MLRKPSGFLHLQRNKPHLTNSRRRIVTLAFVTALSGCAQGGDPGGRLPPERHDGTRPITFTGYHFIGVKGQGWALTPRRGTLCGAPVLEFRRYERGPAQVIHVTHDQVRELAQRRPGRTQNGRWTLDYDMFRTGDLTHALNAAARHMASIPPCPWERRS